MNRLTSSWFKDRAGLYVDIVMINGYSKFNIKGYITKSLTLGGFRISLIDKVIDVYPEYDELYLSSEYDDMSLGELS